MERPGKRVDILGYPLDALGFEDALGFCRNALTKPSRIRVLTLNPLMIDAASSAEKAATMIKTADLVVADGVGIAWAAERLHGLTTELIPGIELAEALLKECAISGRPVFLVGGEEGVASDAAEELSANEPGLRIVGTHHGFFTEDEESRVIEMITSSRAHLVLCGMGFPKQDDLLEKIKHMGKPPPCYDGSPIICEPSEVGAQPDSPPLPPFVGIGVGGSLDVFAGRVERPGKFYRENKLEWLGRIIKEPDKRIPGIGALARFVMRVVFTEADMNR